MHNFFLDIFIKNTRLDSDIKFAYAEINLGVMYANGQGVAQNYVRAHMWFNLAAANGGIAKLTSKSSQNHLRKLTQQHFPKQRTHLS